MNNPLEKHPMKCSVDEVSRVINYIPELNIRIY